METNEENAQTNLLLAKEKVQSFIKANWLLIKPFLILFISYIILYSIFVRNTFFGMFPCAPFSNEYVVYALILIGTVLLARHLIQLKLILYRIFLQTFLNTESKIYKFFSHGFLVRILAVIGALCLSINVISFCALLPVHKHQFVILFIGLTIYTIFNLYKYKAQGYGFIRSDVNSIVKSYLAPFLLSCTIAMAVSLYDIFTIDNTHQIKDASQLLEIAITAVSAENISWPLRVIVRHLYSFELMIEQMIFLPVFGKPIYFIYTLISEGALTFFAILLLFMPYRKEI